MPLYCFLVFNPVICAYSSGIMIRQFSRGGLLAKNIANTTKLSFLVQQSCALCKLRSVSSCSPSYLGRSQSRRSYTSQQSSLSVTQNGVIAEKRVPWHPIFNNQFTNNGNNVASYGTSSGIGNQAGNEYEVNIFDRATKRIQRNRTASLKDYEVYDYIKDEMGWRLYDRICDIKRKFDVVVELGCGRGHVSQHLTSDMAECIMQCDMADQVLKQAKKSLDVPTYQAVVDEEFLPFVDNSVDLVVCNLNLHWVNDLPGCFKQINNALKNDRAIIGSMFGGETLYELRVALQLAETEVEGGFGPHVSPFTDTRDLGGLLNRAGFTLLTLDIDEIIVNYPSINELMKDLQGMGENNCQWNRKSKLHRNTVKRAAEIYKEMYGKKEDGSIPATFQILNFIGWKPDPSQMKAAKRGSGEFSLKDLGKLEEVSKDRFALKDTPDEPK